MKILLVEDEVKVASFIRQGLREQAYTVDVAHNGLKGLKMAKSSRYDLIILDLVLPLLDGIEVCKKIRDNDKEVKILMLTALGTLEDKLAGFDVGADDYLIKPFEFLELLARVKSLTKRKTEDDGPHQLVISDLVLDLDSKQLTRGGQIIELRAKEFAILELLLKNKGKVLSRSEIAERIWDYKFDTGTNVIDVYINFLRKKIDKDFDKKLIHTLIGMGYVLRDDK